MDEPVRFMAVKGVVDLELNRPDVANAFDMETSEVHGAESAAIARMAASESAAEPLRRFVR